VPGIHPIMVTGFTGVERRGHAFLMPGGRGTLAAFPGW